MFGLLVAEALRPQNSLTFAERFHEPTDGSLRYRPWGAVPANPYVDEALMKRQLMIQAEFKKMFDYPPEGTPMAFARMMAYDHLIGEERRIMKNYEGFMKWQALRQPVTVEMNDKLSYFERGQAFSDEIFDIALETDIENFEFGKLTHGYRQRLEHVEPFRCEVEEALEAHGGVVYPKILPYHSISIIPDVEYYDDGTHSLNGFIVRYKRDFGTIELPDSKGKIHILERQLAGFRVDAASGFDQNIVDRMMQVSIGPQKTWQKRYMQYVVDTGARGFIERAIQTDSLADYVVPESTMIYGYKALYSPEQRMAKTILKPVEDDGIAYFGPPHVISKVPNVPS